MAIEGTLERQRPGKNGRSVARRRLQLNAPGTTGSGGTNNVLIHDISESGVLLQTSAPLAIGERLQIELPHAGLTSAKVVWQSGQLRGCQFERLISNASVSAAQLRSQPLSPLRADDDVLRAEPKGQDETFGARLRRLRLERKISLVGFARMVGVSKPTLWKWERNEVQPRRKSAELAAEALGISEAELLFGRREPNADSDNPRATRQLAEVISACKERIAEAAGTTAANVSVTIQI